MSSTLYRRFRLSLASTFRKGRSLALAVALAGAAFPMPAHAAALQVDGVTYSRAGAELLPCIKVALNPQPQPDGFQLRVAPDASARPVLTQSNSAGRTFSVDVSALDAATGLTLRLFPPGPCRDGACQQFAVPALAADGTHLLILFGVTSNDGLLDPGTIRGFNPQPEPPGFPAGTMEVYFTLAGAGPATANVTITVLNQSTGRVVTMQ